MIIHIKDLKITTIIGVHEWEKKRPREIIVNLELEINADKAVESDNVRDTLDYDAVSLLIAKEATELHFHLIEKLASHLLDKIMEDKRVLSAKIEIDKPGAIENAQSVSVIDKRKR